MKRGFALLIILCILSGTAALPRGAKLPMRSYIIIASSETQLPPGLAQAVTQAGGTVRKTIPQGGLALASSTNPAFADALSSLPGIASVIPNFKYGPSQAERYSFFIPYREAQGRDLTELQWGNLAIDSGTANAAGLRGQGVRVAVLDFGIDRYHPDLAPNINAALSRSFIEGVDWGMDVPGFEGWFFGHGSMVSGIIAATDDGFGVTGVAPEAELVMLKICQEWCDAFAAMEALYYAVDIQTDVANMSGGLYLMRRAYWDDMGTPDDPGDDIHMTANQAQGFIVAIRRVTNYVYQHGVTFVTSANNDGLNCDTTQDLLFLPGELPGVIMVSGTAPNGYGEDHNVDLQTYVSWSNYGQSCVDFAAPGGGNDAYLRWEDPEHTFCTVAGVTRMCSIFDHVIGPVTGGWQWGSGTSFSAPCVAGVAALVIGQNGGSMHPTQVRAALEASADDLGKPGRDEYYGFGHINAGNLVP